MDPRLLELLRRLTNENDQPLSDDELTELRMGLTDHIKTVDTAHITPEEMGVLSDAVDYLEVVNAEVAERDAAEQTRRDEAAQMLARVGLTPAEAAAAAAGAAQAAAEAAQAAGEAAAGEEGTDTSPGDEEAAADDQAAAAAVAAAAANANGNGRANGRANLPSIARLAQHRPQRARPVRPASYEEYSGRASLTASADLPGLSAGQEIYDLSAFATACMHRFKAISRVQDSRGDGEKIYFGTIAAPYPDDRRLTGDEIRDRNIVNNVVSQQALTASGGICGPVAVDYSVNTIATAVRPVRGSLAQFGAARGGLRYILPHTLAQVTADAPSAVWTQGTDANPGGSIKPHATFLCQSVQENYVDAVTSIVQFGNFQARYFPEQIEQYLETVDAVHARLAEATLLAAISSGSTHTTYGNYEVGATRDFLAMIDRAVYGYRYRHRLADDTPLRMIFPSYVYGMMREDMARQLPGDSGGQSERLAVSNAEVDGWLAVRNINTTATIDSVTTSAAYGGTAPLQGSPPQAATILNLWPLSTVVWLFHEGAWVFLDGGELNLGMVRDSTLNKTNDFQMFSETFEKAIFRGHESVEAICKVSPTGTSVGTVVPAAFTILPGS